MAITLEEAKALRHGDYVHDVSEVNADGTPVRYKINGKPKTWKRTQSRVQVPLKHGLYTYGYLSESNLHLFNLGYGS